MSWTKQQLISQAFEEIGYADYNFDLAPEQQQSALRKLDAMMAQWNRKGLRLGYPLSSSPDTSLLDQDSNLRDDAIGAVYMNLAVRLAPSVGKVVSMDTKKDARSAYTTLLMDNAKRDEMQITGLPRGAGSKYWRVIDDPFLDRPTVPLDGGNDGEIDLY